jgi:hypothetical protein
MITKRFSRSLYLKHDESAKESADRMKDYFDVEEFTDGDNRYKVDRKGYKNGEHTCNVEVEVKMIWKNGMSDFPYDEINLPGRKKKYLELDKPTSFVIFSKDMQGAVVFTDEVVRKCKLAEVKNKYCPSGEMFFKIPLAKATHLVLNENGIFTLNQ